MQQLFDEFDKIKNTRIEFDTKNIYDAREIVNRVEDNKQFIFIMNTIRHANDVYNELKTRYKKEECFLISGNFCAADKKKIIAEVNSRLRQGKPVYLSATSCVEAGVDFDFPCGAREYAPLDSVIQAMGRVNRNGRFKGYFIVFKYNERTIKDYPSESYMYASRTTEMLSEKEDFSNIYAIDNMNLPLLKNSLTP